MMMGKRVSVNGNQMLNVKQVVDSSVRGAHTDIGGLASKDKKSAAIMIWNYHDDDILEPGAPIEVAINGLTEKVVTLTKYEIDNEHSNSYDVWKKMGSPQKPTPQQIKQLEKAGQLETIGKPEKISVQKGATIVKLSLPRQGVALLKLSW
jgi:xylan 1,4-beta-xylosidase